MISARAAIEQMSSGQMGQPAACMIESNMALSVERRRRVAPVGVNYGVRLGASPASRTVTTGRRVTAPLSLANRPRAVENFVDNSPVRGAGTPRAARPAGPLAQKYGMKKSLQINDLHRSDAACRRDNGRARQCWRGCGVVGPRRLLLCRWLRLCEARRRAARGASPASSARSPRCSSRAFRPAP